MPDITSISAAMGSIKAALDIAKILKDSTTSLEQAEVKLKYAELIGALADAKIEISDIQESLISKENVIKELESKLKQSGQTIGFKSARYLADKDGNPIGNPFCPTCYAKNKDLFPLTVWTTKEKTHKCGNCGNTIQARYSPQNAGLYIKINKEQAQESGEKYEIITFP